MTNSFCWHPTEEDAASGPVQRIVEEIVGAALHAGAAARVESAGDYCRMVTEVYSNDYFSRIVDAKYGDGSSAYIAKAFLFYAGNNGPQHK